MMVNVRAEHARVARLESGARERREYGKEVVRSIGVQPISNSRSIEHLVSLQCHCNKELVSEASEVGNKVMIERGPSSQMKLLCPAEFHVISREFDQSLLCNS